MDHKRPVFFISDRTGITAETLGHTLLTQFDDADFKQMTLPFINSADKARTTVEYINHAAKISGLRPIIFSTTVSDEIRILLREADALFLDLFDTFIGPIEQELHVKSSHTVGRAHGVSNEDSYKIRMDAMNYALHHDDGQTVKDYDRAEVIIIAPSRCGKTPTCIYLAMQHGVFAANYPLTEEDLEKGRLPASLQRHQAKLFGLSSEAERLHQVRNERRPGSKYASPQQVGFELRQAEQLYTRNNVPFVNSANMSIEEIATLIMLEKKIERRHF
jgi:[pyruvate, water dikinase]-phosphate phosphotransferase / [pyruvate, water dikinase] kinase